jgi:hypothetical protein
MGPAQRAGNCRERRTGTTHREASMGPTPRASRKALSATSLKTGTGDENASMGPAPIGRETAELRTGTTHQNASMEPTPRASRKVRTLEKKSRTRAGSRSSKKLGYCSEGLQWAKVTRRRQGRGKHDRKNASGIALAVPEAPLSACAVLVWYRDGPSRPTEPGEASTNSTRSRSSLSAHRSRRVGRVGRGGPLRARGGAESRPHRDQHADARPGSTPRSGRGGGSSSSHWSTSVSSAAAAIAHVSPGA